jgi:hypothetical protein
MACFRAGSQLGRFTCSPATYSEAGRGNKFIMLQPAASRSARDAGRQEVCQDRSVAPLRFRAASVRLLFLTQINWRRDPALWN